MIQMEKKITIKIMETVDANMIKFQSGPFSFHTLMKKMS
jgi:hypothetical protein